MTEPTNKELADALREIAGRVGVTLGDKLIISLAANRLPGQEDGDGWIEWSGGEMPMPHGIPIVVRHRDGDEYSTCAGGSFNLRWNWEGGRGDIVAYKVVK